MSTTVISLALAAAIVHATWNAFLRIGADRLWTVTVMSFTGTAVAIPAAAMLPLPAAGAWPYILASSFLQVGYSVFLAAAYRRGDLGQVYPVVRGSVPLLVALWGYAFAGESLTTQQRIGILLVGLGIMSLSLGRGRADTPSILYALLTGVIIAAYVTVDAAGVRAAGAPAAYIAWTLCIYGVALPIAYACIRGRLSVDPRSPETAKAVVGGVFSMLSYGIVVLALAMGPAGPIAALRETSIIFAALIGRFFLGEALTPWRVAACLIVTCGAVLLR